MSSDQKVGRILGNTEVIAAGLDRLRVETAARN